MKAELFEPLNLVRCDDYESVTSYTCAPDFGEKFILSKFVENFFSVQIDQRCSNFRSFYSRVQFLVKGMM